MEKEYLLNSFLNSHLKRKILVKERIKKTFKWQNKHTPLKLYLFNLKTNYDFFLKN